MEHTTKKAFKCHQVDPCMGFGVWGMGMRLRFWETLDRSSLLLGFQQNHPKISWWKIQKSHNAEVLTLHTFQRVTHGLEETLERKLVLFTKRKCYIANSNKKNDFLSCTATTENWIHVYIAIETTGRSISWPILFESAHNSAKMASLSVVICFNFDDKRRLHIDWVALLSLPCYLATPQVNYGLRGVSYFLSRPAPQGLQSWS